MTATQLLRAGYQRVGEYLAERCPDRRKARLFRAGCCRQRWHQVTDPACRRLVEASERYADGDLPADDLLRLRGPVHRWARALWRDRQYTADPDKADWFEVWSAYWCADPDDRLLPPTPGFLLARDCRPVLLDVYGSSVHAGRFDPRWRTMDAVALARGVYEERAFDRLPILADALMDAGCTDEAVLGHCRGKGPHVRGCWVLDQVLGSGLQAQVGPGPVQ